MKRKGSARFRVHGGYTGICSTLGLFTQVRHTNMSKIWANGREQRWTGCRLAVQECKTSKTRESWTRKGAQGSTEFKQVRKSGCAWLAAVFLMAAMFGRLCL